MVMQVPGRSSPGCSARTVIVARMLPYVKKMLTPLLDNKVKP